MPTLTGSSTDSPTGARHAHAVLKSGPFLRELPRGRPALAHGGLQAGTGSITPAKPVPARCVLMLAVAGCRYWTPEPLSLPVRTSQSPAASLARAADRPRHRPAQPRQYRTLRIPAGDRELRADAHLDGVPAATASRTGFCFAGRRPRRRGRFTDAHRQRDRRRRVADPRRTTRRAGPAPRHRRPRRSSPTSPPPAPTSPPTTSPIARPASCSSPTSGDARPKVPADARPRRCRDRRGTGRVVRQPRLPPRRGPHPTRGTTASFAVGRPFPDRPLRHLRFTGGRRRRPGAAPGESSDDGFCPCATFLPARGTVLVSVEDEGGRTDSTPESAAWRRAGTQGGCP